MGGRTMREGLTVGRSLPAAAIVRLGWAGVNGIPRYCTAALIAAATAAGSPALN